MAPSGDSFKKSVPAAPFCLDHLKSNHAVFFYLNENFLSNALSEFIVSSLRLGDAAVILATSAHRHDLSLRAIEQGIDLAGLKREGRYVEVDVDQTLSDCMEGPTLNVSSLERGVGETVAAAACVAAASASRLVVFGELVALLWARRDFENLKAVEKFWDRMGERFTFALLCGYPINEFAQAGTEKSFVEICAMHSTVISPEEYPTDEVERRLLSATARSYARASGDQKIN